jgi:hypothetical protein
MNNVINLPTADIPARKVCEDAASVVKSEAVVIGWDEYGKLYFASSSADCAKVNWLLTLAGACLAEGSKGE